MASRTRRGDRTPQENEAISDKVELLLSEGYELDQATAIAFRMYRDGELRIPRETSQEYKRQRPKRKSLIQQIRAAAEFLGLDILIEDQKKPPKAD